MFWLLCTVIGALVGILIGRWWMIPVTGVAAVLIVRYGGHGILEISLVWVLAVVAGGLAAASCAVGVAARRLLRHVRRSWGF